jgi:hypothetical protein
VLGFRQGFNPAYGRCRINSALGAIKPSTKATPSNTIEISNLNPLDFLNLTLIVTPRYHYGTNAQAILGKIPSLSGTP